MKSCYCPCCGNKQSYKIEEESKIVEPCNVCGKSLLVKLGKHELYIRVQLSDTNKSPSPA